ncbi:DUF1697 domain-containing protein [Marmoricola sp. RAF53]|uniref:DUF1697 domain-containing protein n=1 Tax=Marmoricola sp. RAF53 TaxID=3233059 RepID=UPI003F9CCC2D
MATHLGFLRAVNIGKRQYKTADLRAALEGAGYGGVETYIQTGNIRIDSPLRSRAKVEAELEALFLADRGFEVTTMVFAPAELAAVVDEADEVATGALGRAPEYAHYVSLLKEPATAAVARAGAELSLPGETVVVRGRAVHLLYDVAFGQGKLSNPKLERTVGPATNRSLKVLREIVARWC